MIALCQARGIGRDAALAFSGEILDDPDFEVAWISEADHREALALLEARKDKDYSLCDAASFLVMRRADAMEAFTTDRHFEQEGFVRLLRP